MKLKELVESTTKTADQIEHELEAFGYDMEKLPRIEVGFVLSNYNWIKYLVPQIAAIKWDLIPQQYRLITQPSPQFWEEYAIKITIDQMDSYVEKALMLIPNAPKLQQSVLAQYDFFKEYIQKFTNTQLYIMSDNARLTTNKGLLIMPDFVCVKQRK